MNTTAGITIENVRTVLNEELVRIEALGNTKRRKSRNAFKQSADRFRRLFAMQNGEANIPTSNQAQEFLIYSLVNLHGITDAEQMDRGLQGISQSLLDYFNGYKQEITRPLPGLPGGDAINGTASPCL
ncbi:hypothetical protein [Qipengyuania atrilutea]|uniref:Uncharacterized protein n=1 Tax=Qipengyuania atrilutea TaxID=2744473 RepID=A0A850H2N6_9SPHN|nr:hypothetical protein [Actirhodobacter atriluteus]NVD44840.1 hypothetical protein [Actirhodobacter atriluteus]